MEINCSVLFCSPLLGKEKKKSVSGQSICDLTIMQGLRARMKHDKVGKEWSSLVYIGSIITLLRSYFRSQSLI